VTDENNKSIVDIFKHSKNTKFVFKIVIEYGEGNTNSCFF